MDFFRIRSFVDRLNFVLLHRAGKHESQNVFSRKNQADLSPLIVLDEKTEFLFLLKESCFITNYILWYVH